MAHQERVEREAEEEREQAIDAEKERARMELDAANKANIHDLDLNVSQGLRLNDSTENKEVAEIALLQPEGSDLDHHRTEEQQEQQNHGEDQ